MRDAVGVTAGSPGRAPVGSISGAVTGTRRLLRPAHHPSRARRAGASCRGFARALLAGGALLGVSALATGCDSSPYAASVNGQVVKQAVLNAQLRQLAANTYYVQLVQQGVVTAPATVAGAGTGSYNAKWTAAILTQIVAAAAAHQQLARTHQRPSTAQYNATQAADSALYGAGAWSAFSPALRTTLVNQDADLALVEPDMVNAAGLKTIEADYSAQLFSNVCVRTVAVSVNGANGRIDFPASLARAETVAAHLPSSAGQAAPGSLTCYTAAGLYSQPLSFVVGVLSLKTGTAAAPQKTATGYTVTAVTSRTVLPADTALGRAFTVALNQNQGLTARVLSGLLARTRVKVNPGYGTWGAVAGGGYAVSPPTSPASGTAT